MQPIGKKTTSLTMATGILLSGLSMNALADADRWKRGDTWELTFGSATATGSYFAGMSAIASLLSDKMDNVRATATVSPQTTTEVYPQMARGERIGGIGSYDLPQAYNNEGPWEGRDIPITGWAFVQEGFYNILALESTGYERISDLKGSGATVAAACSPPEEGNPARWDQPFSFAKVVLEAHGVDPFSDVEIAPYCTSQAIEQMKGGNIDALSHTRALGDGAFMELIQTRDVVLLQPDPELIDDVTENFPTYTMEVPTDVYPDLKIPEPGLGFFHGVHMFLHPDLPEDLVYEMTKTLWENIEVLRNAHPAYKVATLEDALKGLTIPPHPGALRYYKEQNVPGTEQWDKTDS